MILPEVQVAFDFAVGLLGPHGTMCVVSFPNEGFRFSCSDIVFRDIKIIGRTTVSVVYSVGLIGRGTDWTA